MSMRKRKKVQEVPRKRDVTAKELLLKLCTENLPDDAFEDAWDQWVGMYNHGGYPNREILHMAIQAFAHKLMEKY